LPDLGSGSRGHRGDRYSYSAPRSGLCQRQIDAEASHGVYRAGRMTGRGLKLARGFGLHCAAVMLVYTISTPAFTADEKPFDKWFKYNSGISTHSRICGDAADPMRVVLRRKNAEGPLKRIFVLYPRPSSAYDTAITEMLRVFAAKEINVDITVVNFQLDNARGKIALKEVEESKDDLMIAMGSESAAWL